jgi:hypothetical protein
MPFGRHGDLMKMWNGKKHGDLMKMWNGKTRESIAVKCGLGSLETCFCSLFERFAHYWNVLLTIGTFCSLLERFAHYSNVLLTIRTFCSLLDSFEKDRQARRPLFFVIQYCRVRARQMRDK